MKGAYLCNRNGTGKNGARHDGGSRRSGERLRCHRGLHGLRELIRTSWPEKEFFYHPHETGNRPVPKVL